MNAILTLTRAAVLAGMVVATPSMAVTVIGANCISVTNAHGCLYSGVLRAGTAADAEAKYNLYNNTHLSAGPDIKLNYLFNSDSLGFPGTISGATSGTWATPGYKVLYIGVNAGPDFALYRLPAFLSSGAWSTIEIPHGVNLREVRSLAFFGTAVPEPATWALMIGGFGLVGSSMRRREGRSLPA